LRQTPLSRFTSENATIVGTTEGITRYGRTSITNLHSEYSTDKHNDDTQT
jgi:hypothetical protein